jgi:hypothetical protein
VPQHLLFEGPDLEDLLAHVRAQHGAAARIVKAERVRSGGVAGFFAKQTYEITVSVDPGDHRRPGADLADVLPEGRGGGRSDRSATAARTTVGTRAGAGTSGRGPAAPGDPLAALLDAADADDAVSTGTRPRPVGSPVPGARRTGSDPMPVDSTPVAALRTLPTTSQPSPPTAAQVPALPTGARGDAAPATPPVVPGPTFDEVLASVRAQLGMLDRTVPVHHLPTPEILPGGAPSAAVGPQARQGSRVTDDRPVSEIVAEIVARVEGTTGLGSADPDRTTIDLRTGEDPAVPGADEGLADGSGAGPASESAGGSVTTSGTTREAPSGPPAEAGLETAATPALPATPDAALALPGIAPATSPEAEPEPEHASDPATTAGRIAARLTACGLPGDLAAEVAADAARAGHHAQRLVPVLLASRLTAPRPQVGSGDVVVVAGPADLLALHGRSVARALDVPEAPIRSLDEIPGLPSVHRVESPSRVPAEATMAARAGLPLLLLVPAPPTRAGARATAPVIASVAPAALIGVRQVTRPAGRPGNGPTGAAGWLADLSGDGDLPRALSLITMESATAAAAVAAVAGVLLVDHAPATEGLWCALLVDAAAGGERR